MTTPLGTAPGVRIRRLMQRPATMGWPAALQLLACGGRCVAGVLTMFS